MYITIENGQQRKCYEDKDGYYRFKLNYKHHFLHRYIYEQYYKCSIVRGIHVHHIDGNKKNNNIENLELITSANHNYHHKNKGGSICFRKSTNRWRAQVYIDKKKKELGSFKTREEALEALIKHNPDLWGC